MLNSIDPLHKPELKVANDNDRFWHGFTSQNKSLIKMCISRYLSSMAVFFTRIFIRIDPEI